jgi:hypothetical protein
MNLGLSNKTTSVGRFPPSHLMEKANAVSENLGLKILETEDDVRNNSLVTYEWMQCGVLKILGTPARNKRFLLKLLSGDWTHSKRVPRIR